jgi:SMC interacting uncharacterized protein involved in chromosome segregation
VRIFERFRRACDLFFQNKSAFYKGIKETMDVNLEKKKALCVQAEALKESQDWKETSDKMIALQKEWKLIGPVSRKFSDAVWKRFISACDYFFEQKKAAMPSQSSEEKENLTKKRDIITRIKSLDTTNQTAALKTLKELIVEWNSVGFVPFKEKENLHKEYRTALNTQFDTLNVDDNARRLDSFRNNIVNMAAKGNDILNNEHKKLLRAYERMKQELHIYENNLGFFTSSSKKGGGLIEQMSKKTENLRNECKLLEEKIKLLSKEIK